MRFVVLSSSIRMSQAESVKSEFMTREFVPAPQPNVLVTQLSHLSFDLGRKTLLIGKLGYEAASSLKRPRTCSTVSRSSMSSEAESFPVPIGTNAESFN